jgi:Ca2+-binding RTX toxin-like protein
MRYKAVSTEPDLTDAFVFGLDPVPGGFEPFRSFDETYKTPDGGHDGWPGGRVPDDETWGDGGDDRIDHHDHTEDEVIYTFAGDDTVFVGSGDTKVFAGIGNDEVYGGTGNDTILGQDGNDILFGGLGNDDVHAGDGADFVSGGIGDDFIFLTDDNQVDTVAFAMGDGHDVVDGFETGVDVVSLAGSGLAYGDLTISYNGDGTQALVEIDGSNSMIFTGLDGALDAGDFAF